jgi:hypothetical protein
MVVGDGTGRRRLLKPKNINPANAATATEINRMRLFDGNIRKGE